MELLMTLAISPGKLATDDRVLKPETEAQWKTARSTLPECAVSGRRFGGKSWIGCYKALRYAARYPGARVAVCREERASMEGTTLLTMRAEILPSGMWDQCWKEGKSTLFLPNGSEIQCFGLDKPGRALGARYGLVVVDQAEQIDRNQFEVINSCAMQVGMPFHQVLLLFNPESPEHWAYKRYRPDDGDGVRVDQNGKAFAEVIHVLPDDLLKYLSPSSRERFDRMPGVWRQRLRLGHWVAFEGGVFGEAWDPSQHIVAPPAEWAEWEGYPPPDWQRYRGIDFGYEPDPYTCQWWAESPAGVRFLYRQTYATRMRIDQQAEQIRQLERDELEALRRTCPAERAQEMRPYLEELNIVSSFSDHHRGERAMLEEAGITTQPADKDIMAGIQTVLSLLDYSQGASRLLLVQGSLVERDPRLAERGAPTCLEEEMPAYRYRTRRENQEIGRRDLPVDKDNHGIDACRYVHHSLASQSQVGAWS